MFVRFRKSGEWRLKVYIVENGRRDGKIVQATVAYLGSIDTRHLGMAPDDKRERVSIHARVAFWEAVNPKLKALVNRLGGDDEVKRHRMAIHARIPWPMQPERDRLKVLEVEEEAAGWRRAYDFSVEHIERNEKLKATIDETITASRKEAMRQIAQANMWMKEAAELRRKAG